MWASWEDGRLILTCEKVESALLADKFGDNEDVICEFFEDAFAEGIYEYTKMEDKNGKGKAQVAGQGDEAR